MLPVWLMHLCMALFSLRVAVHVFFSGIIRLKSVEVGGGSLLLSGFLVCFEGSMDI